MTVEIGPGKEECFFETVQKGFTLSIDYQVRVINCGKEEQGLRQYGKDIHLVLIIG